MSSQLVSGAVKSLYGYVEKSRCPRNHTKANLGVSPTGVRKSFQLDGQQAARKKYEGCRLLRRLPLSSAGPCRPREKHKLDGEVPITPRMENKPRKIKPNPIANHRVPWRWMGYTNKPKNHSAKQNFFNKKTTTDNYKFGKIELEASEIRNWKLKLRHLCDPSRTPALSKTTNCQQGSTRVGTEDTISGPASSFEGDVLVANEFGEVRNISPCSTGVPHDRRVKCRVGSTHHGKNRQWHMDEQAKTMAYKSKRDVRYIQGNITIQKQFGRKNSLNTIRQSNSCGLYKESRWKQVQAATADDGENLPPSDSEENSHFGTLYSRRHLRETVTQQLFLRWGHPVIDLFATKQSRVVPHYVSQFANDIKAVYTDAFSRDWNFEIAWVFPPPALMPRVLHHLNAAKGTYIVIAPRWHQAFWFPDLQRRALESPIRIQDLHLNLIDLTTNQPPPNAELLRLEAWGLQGGCTTSDDGATCSNIYPQLLIKYGDIIKKVS
nr:unnamed protein product [Callosobruchus analis]